MSLGEVQVVSLSSDLQLFELPAELIDLVPEGLELQIKGGKDEEAVLCTHNSTYSIRKAETSNVLLIASPPTKDQGYVVKGMQSYHYEVLKIAPRLQTLREMLSESPYKAGEGAEAKKTHTFDELVLAVQASEVEVREALVSMHAIDIEGKWRVLEQAYSNDTFGEILNTMAEHDIPLDQVNGELVVKSLADAGVPIEAFVVNHVLSIYSKEAAREGEESFALDKTKIALFKCKQLFEQRSEQDGKWGVDAFMESWEASLPCDCDCAVTAEMLRGIALVDRSPDQPCNTLEYLPAGDPAHLPTGPDVAARFKALFAIRPKWRLEEIKPYIEDLEGNVPSLMLKNARCLEAGADDPEFCAR
jgi:sister chromatid cohesion protein DCC1